MPTTYEQLEKELRICRNRYLHLIHHLSDHYVYYEPADDEAQLTRRVVMSGAQILGEYWGYWSAKMTEVGKQEKICPLECMADWVIIHWAEKTDLPLGETIY